jgi:hypothetical protein
MKKLIVLLVAGLFLSFNLNAKKINGIIFYKNDTVNVTFNIQSDLFSKSVNFAALQFNVYYLDSLGKESRLCADKAKEIRFEFNGELIQMISLKFYTFGLYPDTNIFVKLDIDGKLRLFTYFPSTGYSGGGFGNTQTQIGFHLIQKGDNKPYAPIMRNFRKRMSAYLSDCPSLVEKIQTQEFRCKDIRTIVLYYNSNCE